jgi:predicted RNA binding protein YcfA (HicA-like mRNA interferase family)
MSRRLPALTANEVIRALMRAGFYERRQTGSHVILRKEGLLRPVPIPKHSGDLPRRLLLEIIKEAGLTRDEFVNLL